MDSGLFAAFHLYDDTYWRSAGLRDMLLAFFRLHRAPRFSWRVLEIGSGVGATLRKFSEQFETHGLDLSEIALKYARTRVSKNLVRGSGLLLPYRSESFDLVMSTDVLEHVDTPETVCTEVYRVLRPGGLWMTVVPAYQFLWSERDVRLGHCRRYRRPELRELHTNSGFEVVEATYINLFYLPLFAGAVVVGRLLNRGHANLKFDFLPVPQILNRFFKGLLDVETELLQRINFGVGSAVLCIGRRPTEG